MPTVYQLVIKGDLHEAEYALRQHGFSAKDWRFVQSVLDLGTHETTVHVASHHVDKSLMETVFNTWYTADFGTVSRLPVGSLLFWKPFEPRDATGSASAAPRRGPKIIDDLDGVDDSATHRDYQKPLWATVRSRR
jgi:hypothetical protein